MKRYRNPILALVFFIAAALFVALYRPVRSFFPAQQTELSHGVEYGAVLKDFLFVQEITMKHRYLDRVDLYMAKLPGPLANENVFLLTGENNRILFTKRFSSADFGEALYFPFDLKKPVDIGRGKVVRACIHSIDGNPESYIGLAKKANGTLGNLSVVTIVNNDIPGSLEREVSKVSFTGCIGARTYESDSRYFSTLQIILYLLAGAVAAMIFFGKKVSALAGKVTVKPDRAFLVFSLPFGMAFLVFTPPFMVPDEPVHFYRAYQVSEFNLFKVKDDFPASLVQFGALCDRMQFSTHEKTSGKEILALDSIPLDPSRRTTLTTPDYIFPYLPQAAGIVIGRMAGLPPLWLFYIGRLFNLLVSLFLLYLTIRIVPAFRWVFFLLAVMPMTLFQAASLSYDAITTGLSYLFLAMVLSVLGNERSRAEFKSIARLLVVAALLAAAKQPYGVMVLAFFLLPVSRFGSWNRYLAVTGVMALVVALVSVSGTVGKSVARRISGTAPSPSVKALAWIPDATEEVPGTAGYRPTAAWLPQQPHAAEAVNPIDPAGQKHFILENPARYIRILYSTLGHSLDLYLTSLVGLFGWIDTPLPPAAAYGYLFLLLLFSVTEAVRGIGVRGKMLLAGIFLVGYVLIETALYVYCNAVGCDPITAIQGRYFIALVPLLLLLFSNRVLPRYLLDRQRRFQMGVNNRKTARKAGNRETVPVEGAMIPAASWGAMTGAAIVLICSVFVILERFYVILLP